MPSSVSISPKPKQGQKKEKNEKSKGLLYFNTRFLLCQINQPSPGKNRAERIEIMYILENERPLSIELINGYSLATTTADGTAVLDDETREVIVIGDPVIIINDGFEAVALTPDSFQENYCWCELCGDLHRLDEGDFADGLALCPDCAEDNVYRCEGCGEYHLARNMVQIEGTDNYVCDDWGCMDRAGVDRCEDCGCFLYAQELTVVSGGCYCEDCAPEDSGIMDYGYKPEPEFYGDPTALHMGVELEIDGGDAYGFIEEAAAPEVYFKEDGSLSSNGVEIVSHPCTLDYHKGLWDGIIRAAKSCGFTSHNAETCGLHVHIDRDYLGQFETEQDYTTACIVMLFDKFWEQLVRFSRRTEYQLGQWCERTGLELTKADMSAPEKVADKLQDKANNEGRYKAVNLQNSHTVEFRLFRGTLRRETFYATLELCQVIVDWCKTHRIPELATLTWGELINSQPTEYLVDYCNLRGIDPGALGGEIKSLKVRTLQEGWDITDLKEGDLVKISETARENSISIEEVGKWCVVIASYDNEVRATTLQGGVTWWLIPGDIDRIVRVPGNKVVA